MIVNLTSTNGLLIPRISYESEVGCTGMKYLVSLMDKEFDQC